MLGGNRDLLLFGVVVVNGKAERVQLDRRLFNARDRCCIVTSGFQLPQYLLAYPLECL